MQRFKAPTYLAYLASFSSETLPSHPNFAPFSSIFGIFWGFSRFVLFPHPALRQAGAAGGTGGEEYSASHRLTHTYQAFDSTPIHTTLDRLDKVNLSTCFNSTQSNLTSPSEPMVF